MSNRAMWDEAGNFVAGRGQAEDAKKLGGLLPVEYVTQTELQAELANVSGGGYAPPVGGIPAADLSQEVQDSLALAESALQSFTESDPEFAAALPTLALKTDIPDVSSFVTQTEIDAAVSTHDTGGVAHNDIRGDITTLDGKVTVNAGNISTIGGRVGLVEAVIPTAASVSNKLVDMAAMDDAVSSMAAHWVTVDVAGNPFPDRATLMSAGTFYYRGVAHTPTEHDECSVTNDETHNGEQWTYGFDGTIWYAKKKVNPTPNTQAQQNALDSGINAALVAKIVLNETAIAGLDGRVTDNANDITNLENGKVDNTHLTDSNAHAEAIRIGVQNIPMIAEPSDPTSLLNTLKSIRESQGRRLVRGCFHHQNISFADLPMSNVAEYLYFEMTTLQGNRVIVDIWCSETPTEIWRNRFDTSHTGWAFEWRNIGLLGNTATPPSDAASLLNTLIALVPNSNTFARGMFITTAMNTFADKPAGMGAQPTLYEITRSNTGASVIMSAGEYMFMGAITGIGTTPAVVWRRIATLGDTTSKLSPHLWPNNTEVDFGDGSFGRCIRGLMTYKPENGTVGLYIQPNVRVVWLQIGGSAHVAPQGAYSRRIMPGIKSAGNDYNELVIHDIDIEWMFEPLVAFTNMPYIFWAIYTKQ